MPLGNYELIYAHEQSSLLGKSFQRFDVTSFNQPHLRELPAFYHFSQNRLWEPHPLSGLFSPKFYLKMGINEGHYLSFLNDNPGYDVYVFHPYPRELSLANDFLELAELEHPGISNALSEVWKHIFNDELPRLTLPEDEIYCCHCNYFVGSRRFWEEYSEFIEKFFLLVNDDNLLSFKEMTPYNLSRCDDSVLPLSVFMFERILSHFLKYKQFKVANYSFLSTEWIAPELFDGENNYVNSLLSSVCSENADQTEDKSIMLNKYYNYRLRMFSNE